MPAPRHGKPIVPLPAPVDDREERINAITHGFGALLGLVAAVFLLKKGLPTLTVYQSLGLAIYSLSLILLFVASTLYHGLAHAGYRTRLKQLDHSAIYMLIAGTYTPLLMISLQTPKAYGLLYLLWALAAAGIVFKFVFINRFARLSLATYLAMGWLAVVILPDIYHALPGMGLAWLVAGGLCYSLGTVCYAAKPCAYSHAIWHVWVLLGAACHFFAMYYYVLP